MPTLEDRLMQKARGERNAVGDYWGDHICAEAAEEIGRLREALEELNAWSKAYPLSVFPEPDFAKARELLEAGGMTLDAVSASNMRHVVKRVGEIASNALIVRP